MKTLVFDKREDTRIPFLRGILIGSLQGAGLSFEEAYELASDVRNSLSDREEITSDELRQMVEARLRKVADPDVFEQYRSPQVAPERITVHSKDGKESPFSRGRHERYLLSSGLGLETAETVTELIYDQLLASGITSIDTCELGYLTWLCLRQEISTKAAHRYLLWSEFQSSKRSLLLLIGGSVGSGKSTLATEIAHRLEIVRVQSTDMLREVMRMMVPERLMPVLHRSSFDAWEVLPAREVANRDKDQMVAEGYQTQAELLTVSCEAVLKRACTEGVSVIVEGVHVHPGLAATLPSDGGPIVVAVVLAVLSPDELKSRLRGRGVREPHRSTKTYMDSFDSIWRLQSFLLSEADRCNIPIVHNHDREKAKKEITRTIINDLRSHFGGKPADVFGSVAEGHRDPEWRSFLMRLVA